MKLLNDILDALDLRKKDAASGADADYRRAVVALATGDEKNSPAEFVVEAVCSAAGRTIANLRTDVERLMERLRLAPMLADEPAALADKEKLGQMLTDAEVEFSAAKIKRDKVFVEVRNGSAALEMKLAGIRTARQFLLRTAHPGVVADYERLANEVTAAVSRVEDLRNRLGADASGNSTGLGLMGSLHQISQTLDGADRNTIDDRVSSRLEMDKRQAVAAIKEMRPLLKSAEKELAAARVALTTAEAELVDPMNMLVEIDAETSAYASVPQGERRSITVGL